MLLGIAGGLAIGLLMGLLGGGGAILAIPLFVYGLRMEHTQAVVASLAVVAVGAVVGGATHLRQGHVLVPRGVAFGVLGIIGSVAATSVAHRVSGTHFMLYFAALLVLVAVLMLRGVWSSGQGSTDATPRTTTATSGAGAVATVVSSQAYSYRSGWIPDRPVLFASAAVAVGFLTGFFGVGGGFLIVPALTMALALPMQKAVGTSLLVIFINTVVALVLRGDQILLVDIPTVAPVMAMVIVGVLSGAAFSSKVPASALRAAFGVFLISIAAYVAVVEA
ncbi:sulfite exporter TauE/SafE family protein [Corynebacterium sp. HMSC28B08]|uniref:sulfite exporter TauE/SafE family protein n=1 Tax=Corynebacterium sp. HMSC28B08 TaxID=1581066 RepID=UPI0008A1EE87|nr:sulfite exporter TauE/SafE family protein [Corynebacterium sp. HMSC28B08]OFT88587.1 hypothetical protein HMPREF3098_07900 [Corynebacterium sp. HMSC28B08]